MVDVYDGLAISDILQQFSLSFSNVHLLSNGVFSGIFEVDLIIDFFNKLC